MDRRQFLAATAATAAGMGARHSAAAQITGAVPARKFYSNLALGLLGPFHATFPQTMDLAVRYGFGGVDPNARYLASRSDAALEELTGRMHAQHLGFGTMNLPVDFRGGESSFSDSLTQLPAAIAPLQRAGATRLITWLVPTSNELTYLQNFRQTAERLRQSALVLDAHGLRLGLEYVAPRTSWTRGRYPFLHTMAELRELIAAIGCPNVGICLDSWHWFNAHDTVQQILDLHASDVVAVHLNDAPAGLTFDTYRDGQRELPAATGVIPIASFLDALRQIGYEGPVSAEPNNAALRQMPMDAALAATAAAVKQAFGEMS